MRFVEEKVDEADGEFESWLTLLLERCGLTAREVGRLVGHCDGGTRFVRPPTRKGPPRG